MKTKPPKEKSLSKLKAELQVVFNKFIRQRDTLDNYFICISCQEPKPLNQMNAGHFHPVSVNESLRYDEFNVSGQCEKCNIELCGNPEGYRLGLIQRYGIEILEHLEIRRHSLVKMAKFEISWLIKAYKEKLK